MTSLSLPQSAGRIRYLGRQALSWWLSELSAMMPDAIRRLAERFRPGELVLYFGPEHATLTRARRGGFAPAVMPLRVQANSPELSAQQSIAHSKVRIVLMDESVFHCRIELPAASEPKLQQVLFHQLERLVPLESGSISFTWRIAERISSRNVLLIATTIVKNTTIGQALAFARQSGLLPDAVLIRHDDGTENSVWRETFHPQRGVTRCFFRAIEAATITGFVLAYAVGIARLDAERRRLNRELENARLHVGAAHDSTEHIASTNAFLHAIQRRLAEPTALAVLDEFTKVLPLDASVSEFDLKSGQVTLVGTAYHTTALLNLLIRSPIIENVQYSAPLTSSAAGSGEHFELTARLRMTAP